MNPSEPPGAKPTSPSALPSQEPSGLVSPVASAQTTAGGVYPKFGKAPDLSWVAGRVTFTRIQGSCVYVFAKEVPTASVPTEGTGPIVSTSVANDTSPPLRDITPQPAGTAEASQPVGDVFIPAGPGWDESQHQDGEMVVLFGRLLRKDEGRVMCPGGTHYYVERVQANP
ncbi:MAG: hypothetical protein M3328_07095 [Chloroflexota bacterium]|nr:hypothetical protein [Chloroflexota bacterium]